MDSQQVVNLIDILLKQHHLPFLSPIERILLSDSWNQIPYEVTATKLYYNIHYTRHLASVLWQRLSVVFGVKVTKRRLYQIVENSDLYHYCPPYHTNSSLIIPHYYQPYDFQEKLSQCMIQNSSGVIGIFGILGTGKTTLAKGITKQVYRDFCGVVWHSFKSDPCPFYQFAQKVIATLTGNQVNCKEWSLNEQISYLIKILQKRRCLLVFDQLEELFIPKQKPGNYHKSYESYRRFIKSCVRYKNQSYLLFTSRAYPGDYFDDLNRYPLFQSVQLWGLSSQKVQALIENWELKDYCMFSQKIQSKLDYNPWALVQICQHIESNYQGDISGFLQQEKLMIKEIKICLSQQFNQLSKSEKIIIKKIALLKNSLPIVTLYRLISKLSEQEINKGVKALAARSIVKIDSGFIIVSPLFQEYVRTIKQKKTDTIKELASCL